MLSKNYSRRAMIMWDVARGEPARCHHWSSERLAVRDDDTRVRHFFFFWLSHQGPPQRIPHRLRANNSTYVAPTSCMWCHPSTQPNTSSLNFSVFFSLASASPVPFSPHVHHLDVSHGRRPTISALTVWLYVWTCPRSTDTPQFRGGNPYFFRENPYQSVSLIYASMYSEHVHAIHTIPVYKKIATLQQRTKIGALGHMARQSD